MSALAEFSFDEFVDYPFDNIVERTCSRLGTRPSDVNFSASTYFHGTRLADPRTVKQVGLLALPEAVENVWATLGGLAEVSESDWADFRRFVETDGGGDDAQMYRLRMSDALHHGPNGFLIREMLLNPLDTDHDYLATPEIVEDICRCFEEQFAVDLLSVFVKATTPWEVKFQTSNVSESHVRAAFIYVFSKVSNTPLGRDLAGGWDGQGQSIPAEDILQVDGVDRSRGKEPANLNETLGP